MLEIVDTDSMMRVVVVTDTKYASCAAVPVIEECGRCS